MNVLVVDPKIAGISRDLLLAALVDLTGSEGLLVPLADPGTPLLQTFFVRDQRCRRGWNNGKKFALDIQVKNHTRHNEMRNSAEEGAKRSGCRLSHRKKRCLL
ncbi:MAG: hypothetical protein METHP_00511 [Methanoregula sp. SKADARSKE-2]|nr:MAG: hypothetical protein METHP_00511 [Methanoregula sp. SKADARSKE-2]